MDAQSILDFLHTQGNGIGLIHDDFSRWAVVSTGTQPVVGKGINQKYMSIEKGPIGGAWTFFVDAKDWKPTIHEAVEYYKEKHRG